MADLHHAFGKFHSRIALTSGNKVVLRMAREAIRQRIRKYFRDGLQLEAPRFMSQGSLAIGTAVNPIDGEHDLDDGVYLQNLDNRRVGRWPTVDTARRWVAEAVDGNDRGKIMIKDACVRVRYNGLYHVDLPIYGMWQDQCLLASKDRSEWLHSDPLALTQWFRKKIYVYGEQLRRIIRFLKAWIDFQSLGHGEMPSGLTISTLAANHYQSHPRDDIAMTYTLHVMAQAMNFSPFVPNPVDTNEDLMGDFTHVQKSNFIRAAVEAARDARSAICATDERTASQYWRKQVGGRFPLSPVRTPDCLKLKPSEDNHKSEIDNNF